MMMTREDNDESKVCDKVCQFNWEQDHYKDLIFWVRGVGCIFLSFLGLLMNLFGLCVFRRIQDKKIFHKLIMSLIVIDSFVLVLEILQDLSRGLEIRNAFLTKLYPHFTHPFWNICICCSIYMTICISHERYTALKDPIKYINGIERISKRRYLHYLLSTVIFSFVCNITRFVELSFICPTKTFYENEILKYKVTLTEPDNMGYEMQRCNATNGDTRTLVHKTPFFDGSADDEENERMFKTTSYAIDCIFLGIIPFLLLIYFNASIYIFVRKQRKMITEHKSTSNENTKIENRSIKRQIRMGISFIIIVVVFAGCYGPWTVFSIINSIYHFKYKVCENTNSLSWICSVNKEPWYVRMKHFGHLLTIVNSSVNVLIYGMVWSQFREETVEMLQQLLNFFKLKYSTVINRKKLRGQEPMQTVTEVLMPRLEK